MALFYHMERAAAAGLKRGRACATTWARNRYVAELLSQEIRFEVPGCDKLPIDAILKDHYSETSLGYARRMKKTQPEAEHVARLAARVLEHQAKIIREYVFEEVRAKDFPHKPSRMRGIWLLPHDRHVFERWCASANFKFRAWEVEVSGTVHHGDTKFLEPLAVGGAVFAENARRYWSQPVAPDFLGGEILFEGEFTPVQEIKLAVGRPTMWDNVKHRLGFARR